MHAAHLGSPLAGDVTYDPKAEDRVIQAVEASVPVEVVEALVLLEQHGHKLHAGELGFAHPRSGTWMSFVASLPPAFEHILCLLRKSKHASNALGGVDGDDDSICHGVDRVGEKQL